MKTDSFAAKYASTCAECFEPIKPGDEIVRVTGRYKGAQAYAHASCTKSYFDDPRFARPRVNVEYEARKFDTTWRAAIEDAYGVSLGAGQVYADRRRGFVYAASEYVAKLGATDAPEDATEWADTIAHRPRHTKTIEIARKDA